MIQAPLKTTPATGSPLGFRANSGALYKFAETGHWRGVNDDLAHIGQGLDGQDVGVSAPQPASDRAEQSDVVLGLAIILRKTFSHPVPQMQPSPRSMGA